MRPILSGVIFMTSHIPIHLLDSVHTSSSGGTVTLGSTVFVKVMEQQAPGIYKVAIGNNFFLAKSQTTLEKGTVLQVKIQGKGKQILLIPERSTETKEFVKLTENSFSKDRLPLHIQDFLQKVGLPADEISGRLFSLLQQLHVRPDEKKLSKAYKLASKFTGREKEAAETALFLLDKGIEPTEEHIMSFLRILLGSGFSREPLTDEDEGASDTVWEGRKSSLERTLEKLFGCSVDNLGLAADMGEQTKPHLTSKPWQQNSGFVEKQVDESKISVQNFGLLTLSNHIRNGTYHWIVIPYVLPVSSEVSAVLNSKDLEVNGSIRILVNTESKKTEKIIVWGESSQRKYSFSVYYKNGRLESLSYSLSPKTQSDKAETLLKELFPGVRVYREESTEDGIFCDPNQKIMSCSLEA